MFVYVLYHYMTTTLSYFSFVSPFVSEFMKLYYIHFGFVFTTTLNPFTLKNTGTWARRNYLSFAGSLAIDMQGFWDFFW